MKNLSERFVVASSHHHSGPTRAQNRITSPGVWSATEDPPSAPNDKPLSVDSRSEFKNGSLGHVGRFRRVGGRKTIGGLPVSGDLNPDSALTRAAMYLGDSTLTRADRLILECLSGQAKGSKDER